VNRNETLLAHEFDLYIEDDWSLGRATRLNAGLRLGLFNVQKKSFVSLDPRLSARFLLYPDFSFKLSYARMNQYVHQINESYISLPTDLWLPVSRDFKPLTSDQISAGFYYNLRDLYSFSVEGYYKWMNHILDYKDGYNFLPSFIGWEEKLVSGKGWAYGLDLIVRKNEGNITGWIGYGLMWADRQISGVNGGIRFPAKYDNRHKLNIVINWKINKKIESYTNISNNYQDKIAEFNNAIEKLNGDKEKFEKKSVELRQKEKDLNSTREVSGRELARLEERKINLQKQYDDIIAKLWDEYELTKRQAEEISIEIENVSTARKRLNEIKSSIRGLGSVNVSAIEEYKEVSERYEFLGAQVSDVEKSKNEIERLINDLTKQMKDAFIENFHEINKHFGETFKELFGGGTASLELANPDDILNSGIDIIAHPPGKIVVHLEALSGGEKALVAIALYFSIMKVRPAPFCVMDEIEAALDDVNVDRFAQYMRRMTDRTQFITITHRRGTMEESDVLYGVTMQDEGISKLLELRASEVAAKLGMKAK